METLGDRNVVATFSLLIPKDEIAKISFDVRKAAVNIHLKFKDTDDSEDNRKLDFIPDDSFATLVFTNWDSPLGTSTPKPVQIATTSHGDQITMLAVAWRVGTLNRIDLKFLIDGGTNE